MNVANIRQATSWFQTTDRTQTAIMTLAPGQSSDDQRSVHRKSDQVVIVLDGEMDAEVADEKQIVRKGDVVIVPAGTEHKFTNNAKEPCVSFSVYGPPAYSEKDQ
jgi:mannose-6-phosphate isomerase-like protein (cupin superfamily)